MDEEREIKSCFNIILSKGLKFTPLMYFLLMFQTAEMSGLGLLGASYGSSSDSGMTLEFYLNMLV